MGTIQRGTGRPRPGVRVLPNGAVDLPAGADRDLQDQVIRYLSDAHLRSLETAHEFLEDEEALRAERFSRFLARRYYRDRLSRGFHYSASSAGPRKSAEKVADSPSFDFILDRCVLGSLATARQVGDLAVSHLLPMRNDLWWSELIEYERAFFLQLATSEMTPASSMPQRNAAAVIREFHVQIPELLTQLRSSAGVVDVSNGTTMLLFSRTVHGKIYVVEPDERSSAVFRSIDGNRSREKIAQLCGLAQEEIQRILTALSDIGSVVLPD